MNYVINKVLVEQGLNMSSPHSSSNLGISIALKVGLQASNVLGSHFDSVENAELWYSNYARMFGFGVKER